MRYVAVAIGESGVGIRTIDLKNTVPLIVSSLVGYA